MNTAINTIARTSSWRKNLFVILLPFTGCYVLASIFRTINAVQAPVLMQTLQLSAHDIGLLSAFYLIGYGISQLPLGVWLDHHEPKNVQIILMLFASLGILAFTFSHHTKTLAFSRLLIGLGLAGGLTATLKMIVEYFPEQYFATLNGLVFLIGNLGALFSTTPAHILLQHFGWRYVNGGLALVAFFLMWTILLIVPAKNHPMLNRTQNRTHNSCRQYFGKMTFVFRDRFFWSIAPIVSLTAGFSLALQGLWAGLWITHVNGTTPIETAHSLFLYSISVLTGLLAVLVLAYVANRHQWSLVKFVLIGVLFALFAECLMLDGVHVHHQLILIIFGFFIQFISLSFAILSKHFPKGSAGRASTALVFLACVTGFVMQYMMGIIMHCWHPNAQGVYPINAYRASFGVFVALQMLAFIWLLWNLRHKLS